MTTLAIPFVWCVLQVTLAGLLTAGLYLVVRRVSPSSSGSVLLTGLVVAAVLAGAAVSPWPSWMRPLPARGMPTTESVGASHPASNQAAAGQSDSEVASSTVERFAMSENGDVPAVATDPPSWPTGDAHSYDRFLSGLDALLADPPPAGVGEAAAGEPTNLPGGRWPVYAACLLGIAAVMGVLRFVIGWLVVRRQVARSGVLKVAALDGLCEALRGDLGCRRAVELRESGELATAATVGWRRPVILLPRGWTAWTADERRAVLAHELAHVARGHFAVWLIAQVGLVLHFYHPLIHWLASRLRLEQEYEADALAARAIGGTEPYLQTLARLALRQSDAPRSSAAPLSWPARAFLPTRRTLLRRIDMLRRTNRPWTRSIPTRAVAVTVVLAGGVIAAGVRATPPPTSDDSPTQSTISDFAAVAADPTPRSEPTAVDAASLKKAEEAKTVAPNASQQKIIDAITKYGGRYHLWHAAPAWSLRFVGLEGTFAPGETLAALAGQDKLLHVSLARSRITDDGLARIKDLPGLNHLDLEDTAITDAGLEHLAALQNLSLLFLNGTQIDGAGLAHLSDLPLLGGLHLDRTQVTDAACEARHADAQSSGTQCRPNSGDAGGDPGALARDSQS